MYIKRKAFHWEKKKIDLLKNKMTIFERRIDTGESFQENQKKMYIICAIIFELFFFDFDAQETYLR